MKGSHSNRKASNDEMAYATQVIQEAFPEYDVVGAVTGIMAVVGYHAITLCRSDFAIAGASITPM